MSARSAPLPFWPGYVFNHKPARERFPLNPYVESQDGVRMPIDKIDRTLPGKIHERHPSIFPRGEVTEVPPWVQFDGEVLVFEAYYQETIQEMANNLYQIHKCKLYFFLEDGTIKVNEPKVDNSGTLQGKIIARQRIPLPPPKDYYFFDLCDLNVGKEVNLYGKHFKITSCDVFTRGFLQRLGITVPDPIPVPIDPNFSDRENKASKIFPKKQNPYTDKFGPFFNYDRVLLRFYGYWDDRPTGGNLHDLTILYYLSDGTIQITEKSNNACGKKTSMFIKRSKIPKFFTHLPAPGDYDEFTVLNVLGPNLTSGRFVIDPLNCGKNDEQYYKPSDLIIGAAINIYDRQIILTDCDPFTKEFYRTHYGIDNLKPIEQPVEKKDVVKMERNLPPWNGFGSYEDSEQNCKKIYIKRLQKDYTQFVKLDKFGMDSKTLRFTGHLRTKLPNQCDKKFLISYFLSDNAISVYEYGMKLRLDGRVLMRRAPIFLPSQEKFTSEVPDIFMPQHMFVGANLILNATNFILVDADQYTLRYMELHSDEFPKADIKKILKKVKDKLKPIYKDFVASMLPANSEGLPIIEYDVLREKLYSIMGEDWCEHEMITLARNFSGVCRHERHSRAFIRQIVLSEIKKHIWDDLERMKEQFKAWDAEKTGFLPMKEIYCLIRACKLPLDKDLIEKMISVLPKNDKCEIDGEELFKFINPNYCPIADPVPVNIKTEMWFASEEDLIPGKLIDWCAFNKALDLEYLFKPTPINKEEEKETS